MPPSSPSTRRATNAAHGSRLSVPMIVLLALLAVFPQIVQRDLIAIYQDPVIRLATLAVILSAAGAYALLQYRVLATSVTSLLVTVVGVLAAFVIALVETTMPPGAGAPVLGVSAVGPLIVIVAALTACAPVTTLVGSLTAASMWPLAYVINQQRLGFESPPLERLIVWPGLNYLMAIVACVIARRLHHVTTPVGETSELGSYRLIARIGEGGMGEVWKASHQLLARKAAIKFVRPVATSAFARQADMFIERFRREANVIAGLQSPHTIYLYDFGVSKDGQFYYVMELLDGISLQMLVDSFGPQPPARVRSLLLQICTSLEEAHAQSLIHRDLKPSNVMVCKVALVHDFVKVLDFGLAKCAACEDAHQLSVEGSTAGTPGYIAPEVALGEESVDARADVYALGCVAYYLLTGTLVFPDTNPMSMALKHVQAKPDPLSSRTELPIPADLEAIVMRCLEKKPADRPASVREVAMLLRACDLPDWGEDHAVDWWQRHLPPGSSLRAFPDPIGDAPTVTAAGV